MPDFSRFLIDYVNYKTVSFTASFCGGEAGFCAENRGKVFVGDDIPQLGKIAHLTEIFSVKLAGIAQKNSTGGVPDTGDFNRSLILAGLCDANVQIHTAAGDEGVIGMETVYKPYGGGADK